LVRSKPEVLIIGAGPTGLVLALWLTRLGVSVRIVDKAAEPGTTSRALGVQARTLEFYQQLGIADQVIAGGVKVAGANLWGRGVKAAHFPLGEIGFGLSPFPFALMFSQDAHERLLIERLNALGVVVERPTELVGFEQDRDAVRATLARADGTRECCTVSYLAGCDGAHSTVREQLVIGFPGGTYEGVFYVADVEASGPAINRDVHVNLDAGEFLGIFPLKETGHVRLIGRVLTEPTRELTFDDVRGRAIDHMRLAIAKVNWFSTYHVHHRVADRFRDRRAFLLGDAAHIHSPVGAQGMNTGIGDAVNLAWKLDERLNHRAADALLDSYESERMPFARRLVATTDRAFTFVTKPGAFAEFVRLQLIPRAVPWVASLRAARHFMFRTVSQIAIDYRQSRLSEGAAGGVRGGDRLPWIEIGNGRDNFSPLTSLTWQVHVYGTATQALVEACAGLAIPLHQFEWRAEMSRPGLQRGALYLVRPDGYVALADATGSPEKLQRYHSSRR
jgi:2-polyprenyl-6-methoxyphenol hydroxylase-like FAD-dependent oxidoreductase